MALSNRQTQAIWKNHNRTRGRFFKKYVRAFRALYVIQGDSILESLKKNGAISDIDLLPKQNQDLFVQLYKDVGTTFAETGFLSTKQVSDSSLATWGGPWGEQRDHRGAERKKL